MKFKLVKSSDNWYDRRWDIARREVAKEVAKNYTAITGVDVNALFTKIDHSIGNKTITALYNVNAQLFDKQLPKINRWIINKYKIDKYTLKEDFNFIDLLIDELKDYADMSKVKYDEEN